MADVKQEYGGALYLLCEEEKCSEECLMQLLIVRNLLSSNADYVRLMDAPTVSQAEKLAALDEAFASQVHTYILNFLKILTENGYFSFFGECCDEFVQRYNADRNICIAKITTASPLSEDQLHRLREKLEKATGKTVDMRVTTDPSLIGGLRAELDGRLIDGSVRNKIDSIRDNLKKMVI